MTPEQEKAYLGAKTLHSFCEQFGDDVYSEELLSILFEILLTNEKAALFGIVEKEEK